MDPLEVEILRKILSNCEEVWKNVESSDEWKDTEETNRFPITDNDILTAITSSVTDLLSYRVSKGLKQRYEVRTSVIEILRSWSRLRGSLSHLNTFTDGKNTGRFVMNVLKEHLTDELLQNTKSVNLLLSLYRPLICLLPTNPCLSKHLNKILLRLADLELTEKSELLLVSITDSKEAFEVDSFVLERIYISQKIKFIEQPLTNAFLKNCSKSGNANNINEDSFEIEMERLVKRIVQFPSIFSLASNFMKEIFVAVSYSQEALEFTQYVLRCISKHCESCERDILDLYPINLQSCVILLRIQPDHHSKDTQIFTVKLLKDIFLRCNEDALILISHFPAWLEIFSSFLAENGYALPHYQMNCHIGD